MASQTNKRNMDKYVNGRHNSILLLYYYCHYYLVIYKFVSRISWLIVISSWLCLIIVPVALYPCHHVTYCECAMSTHTDREREREREKFICQRGKLLDLWAARMKPPLPGFQINLWPDVTMTFDLLTPLSWSFHAVVCGPLVPIGIKTGSLVFKILCSEFSNR